MNIGTSEFLLLCFIGKFSNAVQIFIQISRYQFQSHEPSVTDALLANGAATGGGGSTHLPDT